MSIKTPQRWAPALCLTLLLAGFATVAAAQEAAPKIAVIDVQKIILESSAGQAMVADLKKYGEEQQARLTAQAESVKAIQQRISDGQLSLSEDKLAELRGEYERAAISLKRAQDDASREFRSREAKALEDIEKKVMPVIQQVGAEGGYTMIFRKFESGLVFASQQVDITKKVIEMLDSSAAGG